VPQTTTKSPIYSSGNFDVSMTRYGDSFPHVPGHYESGHNMEISTTPNNIINFTPSNLENLPFKVIHPSNFDQPLNTQKHRHENESKNAQNINNNFKIINEPLKFEDFNVVDALMAEPIWSKIEENVSGDEFSGVVSDVNSDHNIYDQVVTPSTAIDNPIFRKTIDQWGITKGHFNSGHLLVPDNESNSPSKQNDETEFISSRIYR
jgi:hypothetical protein